MAENRPRPRLADVAEQAGVSLAAASRALSGSTGVRANIAAHVRAVADQMGYVTNVHARTLASGASSGIGLLVHEIGDPYFAEIASGVLEVGAQQGLTVQICHTGRDPDNELTQIRALIANRVRAIIIAGSGFVDPATSQTAKEELRAFQASGGRVAVVGRHHLGADAVLPENVAGGHAITQHMLDLGHRKIAFAVGSRAMTTVADRLAGAEEALAAAGIRLHDQPIVEVAFTRAGGKQAALELLDNHPETTGVIALNDDMAIGVLSALRAQKVEVPHQVSVTGFDDIAVAEDLLPSLTTIRLPMSDMGKNALRLALKAKSARPRKYIASHELIVRDSTAPPRSADGTR